ncbi:MAG: hypothetical protein LBV47_02265 [Bacteroidales bacterium]|jgi:hypothetical protein|nr:hypothetical protein [Bacteroidales bacterium]
MKKILFSTVFLLFVVSLNAQYFQTGQDPASIKWRHINTENFQLIYPDYYETNAQKLVSVLEKVYKYGGFSLKHNPRKISIILHTQTVKSNGLVALAPKRSEFYTTTHQGIYPQDWLEQLALHEFRHVVQVDKINSELSGIIKAILGEQGTALVFGAYLPWWFIEGDAVAAETALSKYGRGRFPSFLMEHQAQVVEKGIYSYDKAYNGSFRDYVPNHYSLGYYIVGSARQRYGSNLWEKVITNVAQKPFSLNPFNAALKKNTGFTKVSLYKSVFDSLQNVWLIEDADYKSISYKIVSPENNVYANYSYNHYLNDTTIISYKTSLKRNPAFVEISKNKQEKIIFTPGDIFEESVNYRENLIVWSEQIPDLRWSHSGKSLIRILDVKSKEIIEITPEHKAFSPVISPEKNRIAVVETDHSNNNYISAYSIPEGKLLNRVQTENNNYLFSPEWLDENTVAVIILFENGKRLAKMNLVTGKTDILFDTDLGDIKQLKLAGENLFFISSYSGKNSLYSLNLRNKKLNLLYEPRFGVDYPDFSHESGRILLSYYTADGFRIIELNKKNTLNRPLATIKKGSYFLAESLAAQETGIPDFTNKESPQYSSEKYNKAANLFNFHSWAPLFIDAQTFDVSSGISLMSQNKLGTAETILGYKYAVNEKTGKLYADYTFKGWYPVFNLEASIGRNTSKYSEIAKITNQYRDINQDTLLKEYTQKIIDFNANMYIPLNFTKGAFQRLLQPEIQYIYSHHTNDKTIPNLTFKGTVHSLFYQLYYHQILRQSLQDVYPDFGIVFNTNYQHSLGQDADLGNISTSQLILYLPGLLKNHGIKIYNGFQNKNQGELYAFGESILYPRGWAKINSKEMYSFAADYKLPLFYPEYNLGGLVYFRRIDASFFVDYAQIKRHIYENDKIKGTSLKKISSYGIEINSDVNYLRFYAPANIGVRFFWIPETKNVYFNLLYSINFTSF